VCDVCCVPHTLYVLFAVWLLLAEVGPHGFQYSWIDWHANRARSRFSGIIEEKITIIAVSVP